MAMSKDDRKYLDDKFEPIYERLNTVCEQVATNTTDIGWLKWNQRKAISVAVTGVVAALVAIVLAVVGVG